MPTDSDRDVEAVPRVVLYDAAERPLHRPIGFNLPIQATQVRGTNPALYTNVKRKPPKKGK